MMILSAIVGGVEYSLSDGVHCYYMGDDGLGAAPIRRLATRGHQQHGDTDRGWRLDPRFFRLFLDIEATSLPDLFRRRDRLIGMLQAGDEPVKLRWTFEEGFVRQIDAFLVEDMAMPSAQRRPFGQTVVAGFKAPDPSFYDPVLTAIAFGLSGGGTGWPIPWVIPWTIGGSTLDQELAVPYAGTFETSPVIKLVGPITDPVIANQETGEKLDFTGVTIAAADYYLVDTRFDFGTVVDAAGADKSGDITDDSDLSCFHLAPAADGSGVRVNSLLATGSGMNAESQIYVQFYTRFKGI